MNIEVEKPGRGRPKAGETKVRRDRILDAAQAELVAEGYDSLTMQAVAARANASKETLYRWFGSKEALFAALIARNAAEAATRLEAALKRDADSEAMLTGIATSLLSLLTGPQSVALNRAAMTAPALAALLLAEGRYRIGPLVESYLSRLTAQGVIATDDCAKAFRIFYGLVVQDSQICVLLGEPAPPQGTIKQQAEQAVARFLTLYSV